MAGALLEVRNLSMHYQTRKGDVHAIDDVSFVLQQRQVLGFVGESGCGKTSIALSLLGLLPENARILGGQILFEGRDLIGLPQEEMRRIRGKEVSMVFQGAMNALNPVYTVGEQIVETILAHEPGIRGREARDRVRRLFAVVGLEPDRMEHYPHEYSGGMKQRAVIAMALACGPKVVIADEPTTALDVIVQDHILRELRRIQHETNLSMIYISHDIAVLAEVADTMGVMYAGRLVEWGPTREIFSHPIHPYTRALMSAFPSIRGPLRQLQTQVGEPPDLLAPPSGCRFHPRCPCATARCAEEAPPWERHQGNSFAACWHPLSETDSQQEPGS